MGCLDMSCWDPAGNSSCNIFVIVEWTACQAASIMLTRDGQSLLLPPSLAADLCSLDAPATETVGDIEQTDQHSAPAPCDKAAAAQAPGLDLRCSI